MNNAILTPQQAKDALWLVKYLIKPNPDTALAGLERLFDSLEEARAQWGRAVHDRDAAEKREMDLCAKLEEVKRERDNNATIAIDQIAAATTDYKEACVKLARVKGERDTTKKLLQGRVADAEDLARKLTIMSRACQQAEHERDLGIKLHIVTKRSLAALRKALDPFVRLHDILEALPQSRQIPDNGALWVQIPHGWPTMGELRRVVAALASDAVKDGGAK